MYGALKHPEEDITHNTNININTFIPSPAKLEGRNHANTNKIHLIFSEDV